MNIHMKLCVLLSVIFLIASCSDGGKEKAEDAPDSGAGEMATRIRTMEDSLFENMAFDRRNAQMLLDVYKAYAAAYPLDARSPEYLFRAAGVLRSMGLADQSILMYDRIIRDYPGWERLADTYYLKAFTIDTELGHKGDAEAAYKEVINLYPDHKFAQDARAMIENLAYTDEELIARWKLQEAQDTLSANAR